MQLAVSPWTAAWDLELAWLGTKKYPRITGGGWRPLCTQGWLAPDPEGLSCVRLGLALGVIRRTILRPTIDGQVLERCLGGGLRLPSAPMQKDEFSAQPLLAQQAAEWDPSLPAATRLVADELLPLFYADLKRAAHFERVKLAAGSTLQTTALVHEAYLKLRARSDWNDDKHFLRAAALAMRHALINHALAGLSAKRGGGVTVLPLTDGLDVPAAAPETDLLALDQALQGLAQQSLRLAQVVECRYFAGFDEAATAKALGISERTVRRDWVLARAWLNRALA